MQFNSNWIWLGIRIVEVVLLIALLVANTVGAAFLSVDDEVGLKQNDEIAIAVVLYIVNGIALMWIVLRIGLFIGGRLASREPESETQSE